MEFYDSKIEQNGSIHTGALFKLPSELHYDRRIRKTSWWKERFNSVRNELRPPGENNSKQTGKRKRNADSNNTSNKKPTEERIVFREDENYDPNHFPSSNNNNNNNNNNNININNSNNINQTSDQRLEELINNMKIKVKLDTLCFDNKEVEELLSMNPPLFPQRIIQKIDTLLKEISGKHMIISEITFSKGKPFYVRFSNGDDREFDVPPIIIDHTDTSNEMIEDNFESNLIINNNNNNYNNNNNNNEMDIIEELLNLLLHREENKNIPYTGGDPEENLIENIIALFQRQNRAGISSSFHRISAIFYDNQTVTGLTYRIGRMNVSKNVNLFTKLMEDIQSKSKRKSILIIGPPGSGKTTLLRSLIRELAENKRHVIVIDKTEEICGPTELVPKELGDRTRKIVPENKNNQKIMDTLIEAVSNHSPDYVAVDELANKHEASSIVAIGERGISVIATVHGKGIESVIRNKEMNILLGGSRAVILSAGEVEERRNKGVRDSDRKSAISRVYPLIFDVVVELCDDDHCYIIDDPLSYYDRYLELL